jgi:hypothetical protein
MSSTGSNTLGSPFPPREEEDVSRRILPTHHDPAPEKVEELPAPLRKYVPDIKPEDIAKSPQDDPYKRPDPRMIFVAHKSDPHMFLTHLAHVLQMKALNGRLTNKCSMVSTITSYLDPVTCGEFINIYTSRLTAAKFPYLLFLISFQKTFFPNLTDSSAFDTFDRLMQGNRIEDLQELHQYIQQVRVAKSLLAPDWFREKPEILRLRKRISLQIILPLLQNEPRTFEEWIIPSPHPSQND